MNKRTLLVFSLTILTVLAMLPQNSYAQWGIGASYEIRQEDPTNGFGARIERSIIKKAPVLDLRLRAHFSYFSEEIEVSEQNTNVSTDLTNYDFGLAAIGGISVGLITPYVGVGLGSTTFDLQGKDILSGESQSEVFWNVLLGAEVSPIPKLKPFVEYRYQGLDEPQIAPGSSGRMVFGVSFSF